MALLAIEVPHEEEREALVGVLAELCARHGPEPLRTTPLEPTARWFPDAWDGSVAAAEQLARRLLDFGGLGSLDVAVEEGGPAEDAGPLGVAAWFFGIQDGTALFGVQPALLADPESVAGALAHEVAHAFRTYHGVRDPASAREELLTDATTVYLGFGILTANAASRFRTTAEPTGALTGHRWSHSALGYLSPGAMAFLLAVQAVAQGASRRERARVREHLEANQAHAFAAACRLLDGDDAPALRRRLGLPGNARPLGRAEPPAAAVSATTAAPRPRVATPEPPDNSGQRVFRVRRLEVGKAFGALVVGSVTAFFALAFAGAVGAKALGFTGPPFARLLGWIAAVSAALGVGAASRHLRVRTSCSDPACSGAPGLRDASCPACHGQIAGTIRHRDERLDAEEALTDGTGGGTPGA